MSAQPKRPGVAPSSHAVAFGVSTFGEVRPAEDGSRPSDAAVVREVVELGVLAESLGIDYFSLGEHHREDLPISAPDVALAAIAARTERIRLGTAVTVLSTDDPVRVYQRFATLDAISNGRAEPILGRGSFTESFSLFGFDLSSYDELFEERLELFAALREERQVTWQGTTRPALKGQSVYPRTETSGGLTTWIGVGGSPQSIIRTARYGFDLMLAGLGMTSARLAQCIELFHDASAQFGKPVPRVGLAGSAYIADSDQQARDEMWPHHLATMTRIGRERGWPPPTRRSFEESIDNGFFFIGAPDTVVERMTKVINDLGLDRFEVSLDAGALAQEKKLHSLGLLGTTVFPRVRALVEQR